MRTAKGTTIFYTKDVLKALGISRNKLRGLTTAIEKQGRRFQRNKTNQRLFHESDLVLLRQMLQAGRDGVLLDEAAQQFCQQEDGPQQSEVAASLFPEASAADFPSGPNIAPAIALTEEQFRLVVEQVAASAAEKTAEKVAKKYDSAIEKMIERRDRELISRLREASGRNRKKRWLYRAMNMTNE